MLIWMLAIGACACAVVAAGVAIIRHKQMQLWLPAYLRQCWEGRPRVDGPIDVMVCIADHFEPAWSGASLPTQRERVERWTRDYPRLADAHRDSDGRPVQWTFFYPAEEYVPEHLRAL